MRADCSAVSPPGRMTVASAPAVAATIASPATQDLIVFNVNSLISLRFDASRNYGSNRYTME